MEIIFFSRQCTLSTRLRQTADSLLKYHKADLLSLHPASPQSREQLFQLLAPNKYYLIVAQLEPDGRRLAACREAQLLLGHRVRFLLWSQRSEDCLHAVQGHLAPVDCLVEGATPLEQQFAGALSYVLSEVRTVWSGLFVRSDDDYELVPFRDICYIETVKGTHRCAVYHSEGSAQLRENIRNLAGSLDARFLLCRPSTIANLSKVQRIDFTRRHLYFEHGLWCGFSAGRLPFIRAMAVRHVFDGAPPLFME